MRINNAVIDDAVTSEIPRSITAGNFGRLDLMSLQQFSFAIFSQSVVVTS